MVIIDLSIEGSLKAGPAEPGDTAARPPRPPVPLSPVDWQHLPTWRPAEAGGASHTLRAERMIQQNPIQRWLCHSGIDRAESQDELSLTSDREHGLLQDNGYCSRGSEDGLVPGLRRCPSVREPAARPLCRARASSLCSQRTPAQGGNIDPRRCPRAAYELLT